MTDITVTAADVRPLNGAVIRRGTAGGSGSVGNAVYLDGTNGWKQADADAAASAKARGIVVGVNGQVGATTFVAGDALDIVRHGPIAGFSGMTPGALAYASGTAGAVADAAGAYPSVIGWSESATALVVDVPAVAPSTGYIQLPLAIAREIASNDIVNTAGDAGVLSSNTTPILQRVNGATDKKLRLNWAASNVDAITWDISYPPDLDDAAAVVVNVLAAMAGATDTPTLAINYFEGIGDTNAGGNTAAVTGTSVAKYTRSIAAADVAAYPVGASIELVPAAHGTDALYIYGAWIEYTRK